MTTTKRPPRTDAEIHALKRRRAQNALVSVATAVACDLCPTITEEVGAGILSGKHRMLKISLTATARADAQKMIDHSAWRVLFEKWVDEYWAAHTHGPSWSMVCNSGLLWSDEVTASSRRAVLQLMAQQRVIDGTKTPFGLKIRREEER